MESFFFNIKMNAALSSSFQLTLKHSLVYYNSCIKNNLLNKYIMILKSLLKLIHHKCKAYIYISLIKYTAY